MARELQQRQVNEGVEHLILGWVTKVPLPPLTSTRPRSTKL